MITGVSSSTDSTSASEEMKKSIGMNKDDFLQLFITQLQNQDPLNPQDGTEFLSQLAQLTQVEQAYNTNTALEKLLAAQNDSMSLSAVSFIDKNVTAKGDSISFDGSTNVALTYDLETSADSVVISVSDGTGKVVRTIETGGNYGGKNSYTWDGTDNSGATVPAGIYSFSITATTTSGSTVSATTYTSGRVNGLSLSSETPTLIMGDVSVSLTDVIGVES